MVDEGHKVLFLLMHGPYMSNPLVYNCVRRPWLTDQMRYAGSSTSRGSCLQTLRLTFPG